MTNDSFYIAVITIVPLFVLTVGLSTEGFRGIFSSLLGFTNGDKIKSGLITLGLVVMILTIGTICEISSLLALYQRSKSQSTLDFVFGLTITFVLISVVILFLLLLEYLITEGDAAMDQFNRYEIERQLRIRDRESQQKLSGEGDGR